MRPVSLGLVVLLIAALVACGNDDTSQPNNTVLSSAPATDSSTPFRQNPAAELPPVEEIIALVKACLSKTETAEDGAEAINTCALPREMDLDAEPAAGDLPAVIVSRECAANLQYIAWRSDESWLVQATRSLLPAESVISLLDLPYPILPEYTSDTPGAIIEVQDTTRLAIIYTYTACSTAPQEGIILLELEGRRWRKLWDSRNAVIGQLAHTDIQFEDGMRSLRVVGDTWTMRDDPKRQIFHESNPGPHRYFEQEWVLEEEAYVLKSSRVLPSPYNTLVEFVYALRTGDEATAAALVIDPALLATARSNGLGEPPGIAWGAYCGPWLSWDPPCIVAMQGRGTVRIDMVQSGETWLISAIRAEPTPR